MTRMLGKSNLPRSCKYGCCLSWRHYSKKASKVKRAIEKRFWQKEAFTC